MFLIKPLPEFTDWLNRLPDPALRGVVVARIKRLELGLMGDVARWARAYLSFAFTWALDGGCISSNVALC